MIRLLICEDDPKVARLVERRLSGIADIEVLAVAPSGEEAIRLVHSLEPDLLLLDLELPGMDGLQVIHLLASSTYCPEILILTSFSDHDRVFTAISAGAAGYLVKGLAGDRLERGIRDVMAGGTVIEPVLARRFWNYFASQQGSSQAGPKLEADDLELLRLIAQGLTNPEAAQVLGSSRRTIKSRLEQIYRLLGVRNRVEAAVKALQLGLIDL